MDGIGLTDGLFMGGSRVRSVMGEICCGCSWAIGLSECVEVGDKDEAYERADTSGARDGDLEWAGVGAPAASNAGNECDRGAVWGIGRC